MAINLEHANLTVRSLEDSIAFLITAIPEFSVRGKGSTDRYDWVHLGTDHLYIALCQHHKHHARKDQTYLNDGINHLGFVVDDLDTLCKRLDAEGYQHSVDGEESPYRRRTYYYDNNGFEWEFVQYLSSEPDKRNEYHD